MLRSMALFARHLIPVAVVAAALVATAAVFTFARPGYHPPQGATVKLPTKPPAADASGAAGWVWPGGTPGWTPGYTIMNGAYNVSGLQPVEVQAAQLAAARDILDASQVRVVSSIRGNRDGVLAILAAPTVGSTPVETCLAAMLLGSAPVVWKCPGATPGRGDLASSRVLVAATVFTWQSHTPGAKPQHPLYLAGVARGDVYRIVLHAPGVVPRELYVRGSTWGQFSSASDMTNGGAYLAIYGKHGLVEKLHLDVAPGQQRVFQ